MLGGRIGIVGLENPENFARFISLFKCDYDKISCALLIMDDYHQVDNNGKRCQLGSTDPKSWQNLFHESSLVKGFENTKEALELLLYGEENFSDTYLEKIIEDYLADCEKKSEFEWAYYFIKYKDFRPPRYGKYYWEDFKDAPYCFAALYTEQKMSVNSYQPFLKAAAIGEISRDELGMLLDFGNFYVECENDSYVVKNWNGGAEQNRLTINQRNGIDTEDRIKKFKTWAADNFW